MVPVPAVGFPSGTPPGPVACVRALAQSGLVAVDVDPRNGGTDTFEQLQAAGSDVVRMRAQRQFGQVFRLVAIDLADMGAAHRSADQLFAQEGQGAIERRPRRLAGLIDQVRGQHAVRGAEAVRVGVLRVQRDAFEGSAEFLLQRLEAAGRAHEITVEAQAEDASTLVAHLGAAGETAAIVGELRPRTGEPVTFDGSLGL